MTKHDSQIPAIRNVKSFEDIEVKPWYKALAESPWLAAVGFVVFVLVAAGLINLAACIF
jgi:hypothetical protein